MKHYSITKRLVVSLVITVLLVSAVTISLLYFAIVAKEKNDLIETGEVLQENLVALLRRPLWDYDLNAIKGVCEMFSRHDLVVHLVLTDGSGRNIFSMEKEHGPDLLNRSDRIYYLDEYMGHFSFSLTKRHVFKAGYKLLFSQAATLFMVLSSLLLVAGIFVRRLLRSPLRDLDGIARNYAAGKYDMRVAELPYIEFQSLGGVLVQMGAKIKRQMEELREHRDNLEQLVNSRTDELAAAKEQAEASKLDAEEANRAKSDFLARMSHEIRTPLNAVTGFTHILLNSKLSAVQRDYLEKVLVASENLLEVINDILDFSKIEAGQLELIHAPFDLGLIFERLADLFSNRTAEKDLELIFYLDPAVPRQLKGDAGRLIQVLTNLIENSIKFTEAGEVIVRVEVDDHTGQQTGRTVFKFQVSDTGIGIAADELPRLFEPFTQEDRYLTRKHEGTGLGLAICQRLVELMGGGIRAESIQGRGSTFSFTVLLEAQEVGRPHFDLPPELSALRVLVADDSTTARSVLVDLLQSCTMKVAAVDSGEKVIEVLSQAADVEPCQLVVLDWKMPGLDGIETAKCIRALGRKGPGQQPRTLILLLVTAYGLASAKGRIDSAGVDALLLKPVKPTQLVNTIIELFGLTDKQQPRNRTKSITRQERLQGQRVLVVEDSELNREVVMALLVEAGLEVETVENGRIGVERVTGLPGGHYSVVIMDIQMPVMDGYEATRRIREFEQQQEAISGQPQSRIPIIALTAHALKGEKEKCLAAGMDDYLPKPIDHEDLLRKMRKWLVSQPGR